MIFILKVKFWITINEPEVIANLQYGNGQMAPGIKGKDYIVAHNLIKAHAKTYRLYQSEFKKSQKGIVGITLSVTWMEPKDPSNPLDVAAAERGQQFNTGWFTSPVVFGDYPSVMREYVDRKSKLRGLLTSRLPSFTPEEKEYIKGSQDFIGINLYTSNLAEHFHNPNSEATFSGDQDLNTSQAESWPTSGSTWLRVTPFGMRRMLNWMRARYNNITMYITENGVSDKTGTLKDTDRITYYKGYINEVLKAVKIDKCDVRGYTAWSLMDNFEWMRGYTERFGLHHVDFSDPKRPRVPKNSAKSYTKLVVANGFEPETNTETIIVTQKPSVVYVESSSTKTISAISSILLLTAFSLSFHL